MFKKYLLISLDELDLAKKLDFNIFIQEYVYLRELSHDFCTMKEGHRSHNRDFIINLILEKNKINLSEAELYLLTEMVESKWEILKKIENQLNP